jgi:hypothetical protein
VRLLQEKINSFLNHNAGAADILDRLLETFGSDIAPAGGSPTRRSAMDTKYVTPYLVLRL